MIYLTRLQQGVAIVQADRSADPNFTIWWEEVVKQIEQSINEIIEAQEAAAAADAAAAAAQGTADGAQTTADGAATAAGDAQSTADTALGLAQTAVQQEVGPSWADATGTADRTAFSPTSPVGPFSVSNPPTQAEVQAIGSALVTVSNDLQDATQHIVALVNDLYANKALTN